MPTPLSVPRDRSPRMFHVKHPGWARLRLLVLLLCVAFVTEACTVSKNPLSGNRRAYGYTWAQEREIGQQQDALIVQQFGVVEDQALTSYVERIGEEVLNESQIRGPGADPEFANTPFTFRVLDSEVVNAFALPGGFVYVTRGLLTHLNNEAQLAVVLGHEVTHVVGRHASKRAAEQQFGQLGLIGGAVLGGVLTGSGNVAEGILNAGGTGLQLFLLQNSRDDERESDYHGVSYAAMAGYAASEGSAFFRSLDRIQSSSEGGGLPSWLSTHPEPYEREQRIIELANEWQRELATPMDRIGRETYLQRLEGVVLGANPREGYVESGTFYHPELRFAFPVPNGFQLDNQRSQVVMAAGNNAVMVFAAASTVLGQEVSGARQAAQLLSSQEGVQTIESGATTSNGLPAYYTVVQASNGQQTIRVLAYFIEYGNTVWSFLGYSTPDGFAQYQNSFLNAMRGFRQLTESRYLNVQPTRLNVVPAPRTAAFSSFVPSNLPRGMTALDLAIINQVELDETIQRGYLLKLPR